MKKYDWLLAALLLLPAFSLRAQEQAEDNSFGGWEFVEIYHDFGKGPFFASFYFEHDNFQYQRFECWYTRTTVGVKILPWLKADVAYDFLREPAHHSHRAVVDLTGTLRQGNLKASVRERYMHSWTPATKGQSDVLRSRLKVQYDIPNSHFSPYVAVEVFTWGVTWKKTRHYLACCYNINEHIQLEAYYLYYAFATPPAEHVLGIGINFDL